MKVKFPRDSPATWHKSSTGIKSLFTYKKERLLTSSSIKYVISSAESSAASVCNDAAGPRPGRLGGWSNNRGGWWFETGSALAAAAVSLAKTFFFYPQCFALMSGADRRIASVILPRGSCGGTCSLPPVVQMNNGFNVNAWGALKGFKFKPSL